MITRFASTFTDALGRLQAHEQKSVKTTAFDLQMDPRGKGLSFHRIEQSRDPNFWSVRVNADIRIIVHKQNDALLLAYVDHHDKAYAWAERKRIEVHPKTGAAQFVEVPIVEATEPDYASVPEGPVVATTREAFPFASLGDEELLSVGVPVDWLSPVRETPESALFDLLDRLPQEASEALLDVATGGKIGDHLQLVHSGDPFEHPDALRRFRTVENLEELRTALDQPFEKWAVFLHPAQHDLVERDWSGPARVAGTAGTGKTIVALHRAVHLARQDTQAKVLLTTFNNKLAEALAHKRDILTEQAPALRDRVIVRALDQAIYEIYSAKFSQPTMASSEQVLAIVRSLVAKGMGGGLSATFIAEEWEEVIDAWNVVDAGAYATVLRLGRKTRLGPKQRDAVWELTEALRTELSVRKLTTWAMLYARLTEAVRDGHLLPFTHYVIDEAQDLTIPQLRLLSVAGKQRADALFFAGDLGQRIFHLPFSWVQLGVDIRGRSHALKVNYRTSHQIRLAADRLLPDRIADMDGIEEGRRGTVSVFDGPEPAIQLADNEELEFQLVANFIKAALDDGIGAEEIGVLVRAQGQINRARQAVKLAGLDPRADVGPMIATMHDAKGLEFRAVVVMACDEDILPNPERLAMVGDETDLQAAYETERHLLYVACTRARDRLLVSGIEPGSEFLEDML